MTDEPVDGPALAAKILSRMPERTKERLTALMRAENPAVTAKVEENLVTLRDIAALSGPSLQALLTATPPREFALAVAQLDPVSQESVVAQLPANRKRMLEDELTTLASTPRAELDEAARRILARFEYLRERGVVRREGKDLTTA